MNIMLITLSHLLVSCTILVDQMAPLASVSHRLNFLNVIIIIIIITIIM
jgi:hypothetical protein